MKSNRDSSIGTKQEDTSVSMNDSLKQWVKPEMESLELQGGPTLSTTEGANFHT